MGQGWSAPRRRIAVDPLGVELYRCQAHFGKPAAAEPAFGDDALPRARIVGPGLGRGLKDEAAQVIEDRPPVIDFDAEEPRRAVADKDRRPGIDAAMRELPLP